MRFLSWLCWGGLLLVRVLSAAQSPASIPEPRRGAWVVDLVGVVPPAELAGLNALGDATHQSNGAVLAAVVIDSTQGIDQRRFATDLFNRWRLGDRNRDNGLLLFIALEDRAAEIILGDGIDSDAQVAQSERIMRDTILPRFRAGNPADAIASGMRACAETFFGVGPAGIAPAPLKVERESPGETESGSSSESGSGLNPWLIAGAGSSGLVGFGGWLVVRSIARRRPRRCRNCATTMVRLDEAADDAHLGATERAEEKVGSVDYDIWLCPGCNAVEKLRYGRCFTRYSKCPMCGGVTKHSSQRTLQSATTMSTGLAEVHEKCASCAYTKTYTRVIPRVSSSSSSSGRSGGGSSSGRGASGRW